MSRHVPRSERWTSHGPNEHRSTEGYVVRYYRGAWWAEVGYRLRQDGPPERPPEWEMRSDRLGPFKRPRNAMVEAERHATMLRNRHGEGVRLGATDQGL
jgi:hypothetical protein